MARSTLLLAIANCLLTLFLANAATESAELQSLLRLSRDKPGDPPVLLRLAQEYSRLERDGDVVETVSRLVDASRNLPTHKGLLADSVRLLEPIHRKDPRAFPSSYLYAEVLFLTREYSRALRVLSGIGPQGGSNPDFLNLAAMCFGGLNDLPKASQALIRAIELAPNRVDLLVNLAGLYQRAKNNEAAVMALEKAARMASTSPVVFFTLALSRFNLGDFRGAVQECKKTVGMDPVFHKAYLLMGKAYTKMGNTAEAVKALRRASELDSSCDQCKLDLALMLLSSSEIIQAEELLREAIAINPRNAEAQYQLAKILSQQNRIEEAVEQSQRAVTIDSDHDGAQYLLAMLYRRQGNAEQSREILKALRERKERRRAKSQADLSKAGAESRTREVRR